jgi:Response regulators consisting of a CheY-like receiver domain and a winged-helix DNA-binding domain
MTKLLIVEDEPSILRGLADQFQRDGYEVATESDGNAGYAAIGRIAPDLILLDLMLPGMSGYEICRQLRRDGNQTPVLMLTARGEEADRVLGLDLGADDYLTKPFSLLELLARVRALLRRARAAADAPARFRFGGIEIDFNAYSAAKDGQPLDLTRREFQLLRTLLAHPNQVLTRDRLLDVVVGEEVYVTNRVIDNHIAALRSKLEDDPAGPRHLLTVRGVGYKWNP